MKIAVLAVLSFLAALVIVATVMPLIRHDQWWIRIFDFPRVQVAVGGLVVIALYLVTSSGLRPFEYVLLALVGLSVGYQIVQMLPYTRVYPNQVVRAERPAADSTFSLLIANVLMTNREVDRFLALVREKDPDVILTVETDAWWDEHLAPLEEAYPNTVKEPLDNTYGMLLYSRLELIDPRVDYLVAEDIPSIFTQVRLPAGAVLDLYAVHPEPPYPKEARSTTERDAELLLVGRKVKERQRPAVVAGDLNDVAWSYTTDLFQEISGMLDPRRGRGMYNTFSAKNPILRWPLDHVFHSEHFKLVEIERLAAFGSDHFPVYVKLAMDSRAPLEQAKPQADPEEMEAAEEKIEKAADPASNN